MEKCLLFSSTWSLCHHLELTIFLVSFAPLANTNKYVVLHQIAANSLIFYELQWSPIYENN